MISAVIPPESTEHFFFDCPKYATPRVSFLQALSDIGINILDRDETLHEILYGSNFYQSPNLIIDPVITYMSVTNRFK